MKNGQEPDPVAAESPHQEAEASGKVFARLTLMRISFGVLISSAVLSGAWTLRAIQTWAENEVLGIWGLVFSNFLAILVLEAIASLVCFVVIAAAGNALWSRILGAFLAAIVAAVISFAVAQAGFGTASGSAPIALACFVVTFITLGFVLFVRLRYVVLVAVLALIFMISCAVLAASLLAL